MDDREAKFSMLLQTNILPMAVLELFWGFCRGEYSRYCENSDTILYGTWSSTFSKSILLLRHSM